METLKNLKIVTPQDILDDNQSDLITDENIVIRKGTIKCIIDNVKAINKILIAPASDHKSELLEEAYEVISSLVPSLKSAGIFDLFNIEEWLTTSENNGRIIVALLVIKEYSDELFSSFEQKNNTIKILNNIKNMSNVKEIKIIIDEILSQYFS